MKHELAFVIPVGDCKSYLRHMIETITRYLLSQVQVIVILDQTGAEEETTIRNQLSKVAEQTNIKDLLRIESVSFGNPGESRNFGLTFCDSKWTAFIDSDDSADPEKYLKLVREANVNGKNLAVGAYQILNATTEEISEIGNSPNLPLLGVLRLARNPGIWRWVIKSERLGSAHFPPYKAGEDQAFLAILNPRISEIYTSSELIYTYVQNRHGQLTKSETQAADLQKSLSYIQASNQGRKNHMFSQLLMIKLEMKCQINRIFNR
jgi:hypothetical protein